MKPSPSIEEVKYLANPAHTLRCHAWSLIALLGIGLCLLAWTSSSPIGSSPDEPYHLTSIWCATGYQKGICEPDRDPRIVTIPSQVAYVANCFARNPEASGSCQAGTLEPLENSTFTESFWSYPFSWASSGTSGYPPIYYHTAHYLVGADVVRTGYLIRAFNAGLFLMMLSMLVITARRRPRRALMLTACATLVPLGFFLITSTNPSSWTIAAITILPTATFVMLTETRNRDVVVAALVTSCAGVMAAGSRSDGAAYAVLVIVAVAIMTSSQWRTWLQRMKALSVAVMASLVALSTYFFMWAEQTRFGTNGMSGPSSASNASSSSGIDFAFYLLGEIPSLWSGGLGGWALGWLDTPVPSLVPIVMSGIVFALITFGLRDYDRPKTIAIALSAAALFLVPFRTLYVARTSVGESLQPRYILPLLIILVSISLLPPITRQHDLRLSTAQWSTLAFAAATAHAVALHVQFQRYTTGLDVRHLNLNTKAEWLPPGPLDPMTLWLIGSLGFGIFAACAFRGWNAHTTERANDPAP